MILWFITSASQRMCNSKYLDAEGPEFNPRFDLSFDIFRSSTKSIHSISWNIYIAPSRAVAGMTLLNSFVCA
ncbi:hypothetical protein HZ326_0630 [Fusarium oxysporum f. sp. albedinis]|nr:hypothetical protein HZ326_0630 [Fusarium oxysporum f. sp. albedinis]